MKRCLETPAVLAKRKLSNAPLVLQNLIPGTMEAPYKVTIDEILNGPVQSCILMNYLVDVDFIYKACPSLRKAKLVSIVHGTDIPANHGFPNLKLHKARLPIAYGTHHTKLMIVFYESGVRLCIGTANLVPGDWLFKSQMFWIRDFPKKSIQGQGPCPFETDLLEYLQRVGFLDYTQLNSYDFSSANCHLIASVPGYHKHSDFTKFGLKKVGKVLTGSTKFTWDPNKTLTAQFSSLGSLDEPWLVHQFARCLGGSKDIRLIFPTVESVRSSLEGYQAGGSIPASTKNMKSFIRSRLYHWNPENRAMPHLKTYALGIDSDMQWFMLSSANLSRAAWGTEQKNGTQFMTRSYELGVLFIKGECSSSSNTGFYCCLTDEGKTPIWCGSYDTSTLTSGVHSIPLPYSLGAKKYTNNDQPWIWDAKYSIPDIHGNLW